MPALNEDNRWKWSNMKMRQMERRISTSFRRNDQKRCQCQVVRPIFFLTARRALVTFINTYEYIKYFYYFYRIKYKLLQEGLMENNDKVDEATVVVVIAEDQFQSAYDRSSSDGNYEKKTEELVSENQQRNELDEKNLGRSISREEERQSFQASSIRLASEQKRQEISNLKKQWMVPSPKEKMAKQIEYLNEQNKALRLELVTHESSSQILQAELAEKQDIIASLSKRIQYFESLLSVDVKDMKNFNKRITEQLLSDLQKTVTMQVEKAEQRRARIERDYVKKEDYQQLRNQKLVIEQELQKMKENHQVNTYLYTNQILERQNAEYLEEISKLKQALSKKLEENSHLERRICEKQSEYGALQKHISSNDTAIASQILLIEQYQAQIESLKTLNAKLHQKCTNILSQTKDHIFLQFSEEIKAFTEQLEKLNEQNKQLKEQFVKLKTIELDNDRERMLKEIQLTFSRQKIFLFQAVIKEKQDQAAEKTLAVESILKMKNEELEAQNDNIKHLEKIIQDTTIFYTRLLQSKQAEWKILNQMNDDKTKTLEIIISIREQTVQELTKKLNRIESDHAEQKKKLRQEYKQQLSKSENCVMQLQLDLDQTKQQAGLNSEEKERLLQQNRLMISLVKLIQKNQDNLKNILAEIESINKDHAFDGIAAAFFSLSQKMQNNELQIKTHQLALKKMQEQLQQNATQLQSEGRIRQLSIQENASQIQSLANQLKQKAKIIQQLQEKVKISSKNETQVKQFTSTIESYILQINEKKEVIQGLQKEKFQLNDKVEKQSIQIQEYRSESTIYQYKIVDLQSRIKQLSRKNEPLNSPTAKSTLTQDKQLQLLKRKYDSLLEELDDANKLINLKQQMIEAQKITNQFLEQKIATLEQRLKKSSKAAQIQEKEKPKLTVNGTCCFFTAKSMIEGSKGGRQFVVKSVQNYCSREVKAIEMVFRKDESNNNSFHFSFKPADLSESICLFLLKKTDVVFGIATFPEAVKGTPSAILLSVTNEKCVFKSQEGFDQAFVYEQNAITFGKKEIKIKSGFKNMTIPEAVYKGYFESYVKREVFGPEFKEVSEFDSFEIHKIYT